MGPSSRTLTPPALAQREISSRLGRPVSLTSLGGYLARNQIYLVPEASLVLKIFHLESELRWQRERAAYGGTLPDIIAMPRLRAAGLFSGGAPWILSDYIEGKIAETLIPSMTADERSRLSAMTGLLLGTLHSAALDRAPGLDQRKRSEKYFKSKRKLETEERPERALVRAICKEMKTLSEQAFCPSLSIVHGDFSTRNVIMQQSHHDRLVLIDFELAGIADPMEDLAKFAFKEFGRMPKSAFLDSYVSLKPLGSDSARRFAFHFLGLLIEIMDWAFAEDHAFYREATRIAECVLDRDPLYSIA